MCTNRVSLITGAGSGIGAATSIRFAQAGAKVCCVDINIESAQATVDKINKAGGDAFAYQADVSRKESNFDMVGAVIDRYEALDFVHLNAGVLAVGAICEMDVETWDRVMAVNLRGVFFGLQAAFHAMKVRGKGGAIVVTCSIASFQGDANMSIYSASKHGAAALVKCAAAEFAADHVRVNGIAPGAVATPMATANIQDIGAGTPLANMHPLGRIGIPEEIAELVVFLSGEKASFITGGIYPIDGGVSALINPRFLG